jgi:hypothetical protein
VAEHPGIVQSLGAADRGTITDEAWATNAPAVTLMLTLGFDPAALSMSEHNGGTALHCAAWKGSSECVAAILADDRGRAMLEVRDLRFGTTPLHWCGHGSVNCRNPRGDYGEVARLLIAAGALVPADAAEWDVSDEVESAISAPGRGG